MDKKSEAKAPAKGKSLKVTKSSRAVLLEKEVKTLTSSLSRLEDRYLRLRAEFDNYNKRKEREISRLFRYEGEAVIRRFLPVVDDLERMIQSTNEKKPNRFDSFLKGMNLVLEKLNKRLKELEVESFESVGKAFNPEFHEAVMTQESDQHEDHEIIEQFEKGYTFKDRVLRHAKVVVNSLPGEQKK